jgi:hypothetical protein
MARDANNLAPGETRSQSEGRRAFLGIKQRHDGALAEASAAFANLARAITDLRFAPSEQEERFWTAVDDAAAAAASLHDSAETWGLAWVSASEQNDVSRLLHSGSDELPARSRGLVLDRLTRLWDAWPLSLGVAPLPPRPEVAALNLKNVARLALALMKAGQGFPGAHGNLFDRLAGCLSEHLGLPAFVLPEAQGARQRPLLVSSLIDPRLGAAWAIKEAAAALVPPELATLPATLQALSLAQEGLFGDAALMGLIYGEDAALVALHHEWKTLTLALPDPRERAALAADLTAASEAAQAQFGVYILSGEIEGTVERLVPPGARTGARRPWWWCCRCAGHYAAASGTKAERLLQAEARLSADLRFDARVG